MVVISYYHAFRLRPRLAAMIGMPISEHHAPPLAVSSRMTHWREQHLSAFEQWQAPSIALTSAATLVAAEQERHGSTSPDVLVGRIIAWLRIEASVGLILLLCAMLLGPLAGTLAPSLVESSSFGATGGVQHLTQMADQLNVSLRISRGHWGQIR